MRLLLSPVSSACAGSGHMLVIFSIGSSFFVSADFLISTAYLGLFSENEMALFE